LRARRSVPAQAPAAGAWPQKPQLFTYFTKAIFTVLPLSKF